MSAEFESIKGQVEALIPSLKAPLADGFQFSDVIAIVTVASDDIVKITQELRQLTGPQKKAVALEAVDFLYARVIAPYDIKGVPDWVEHSIVDPALGSLLHTIASGILDGSVTNQWKNKVFKAA